MKKLNVKKLSVAIRQALDDLRACEKDDRYAVNMSYFHMRVDKITIRKFAPPVECVVCFSGAVVAKRLRADPQSGFYLHLYQTGNCDMFAALDFARMGRVDVALARIGEGPLSGPYPYPRFLAHRFSCVRWLDENDYSDNPGKFKRSLSRVAEMLGRRGL